MWITFPFYKYNKIFGSQVNNFGKCLVRFVSPKQELMVMAVFNIVLCFVVLYFSSYPKNHCVCGARVVAAQVRASTCSASNKGFEGLQLYHRHGPCSPLGEEESSAPDSHQIFLHDQSRVDFINSLTNNYSYSTSTDKLGEKTRVPVPNYPVGGGNFVVTVGFGTPQQKVTLILDTGSDVTWIQCKPCPHCYRQKETMYDPQSSSTFSKFPCSSASSSSCSYSVKYADNSQSQGYYVQDTLTLSPHEKYPNFVFGCGQDNSDGFGKVAGMLGIGQYLNTGGVVHDQSHSFMSQIAKTSSNIFCYCLPAEEHTWGYLLFGDEALQTCRTDRFTPLLKDERRPLYFVNLTAITFGGLTFDTSSSDPLLHSSSATTILDSGTVITHLPPSLYSRIRSVFQKFMSKYPTASPFEQLDTCYKLTPQQFPTIPKMVLHFENADVSLDSSAVIWSPKKQQLICLAFVANNLETDLTIIGNHQQRKLNILYNIQEQKVQFGVGNCGH